MNKGSNIIFPNLRAEMARQGIKVKDISKLLNVSEKTVRNYLNDKTKILWLDALKIRNDFFQNCSIDYLFYK